MKRDKEIIYWDACIFLAWLQDEPLDPGIMEGIEDIVRRVNNNEAILVTSIMTRTEVLDSRMPKAAREKSITCSSVAMSIGSTTTSE